MVCNTGSTPTYRRVNAASIIDVTLVKPLPNIHPLVKNCKVLEDHSANDHMYIFYTVVAPEARRSTSGLEIAPATGWSVRKLNPELVNVYWDLVGVPSMPPAMLPPAVMQNVSTNS